MADELNLHNLKPAQPRKARKRVGRGLGSARAATRVAGSRARSPAPGRTRCPPGSRAARCRSTCGSRSSAATRRRTRCRSGRSARTRQPVNVRDLDARFDAGDEVTPETLKAKGLIRKLSVDVKILGVGELTKALTVSAHGFSKTAREKIEAAGGTVVWLRGEPARSARRRSERRAAAEADVERPSRRRARRAEPPTEPSSAAEEAYAARRRRGELGAMFAGSRTPGGSRSSAAACSSRRSILAALPARLVDPRAGRRRGRDRELLLAARRRDLRPAEPLLRRRAVAVLDLRARDHAVRHGLDHRPADDGRHPAALRAAEGRRVGVRQDQPVHALPDGRARGRCRRSGTRSCSRTRACSRRTPAAWC